jgi:hypothetical protein
MKIISQLLFCPLHSFPVAPHVATIFRTNDTSDHTLLFDRLSKIYFLECLLDFS